MYANFGNRMCLSLCSNTVVAEGNPIPHSKACIIARMQKDGAGPAKDSGQQLDILAFLSKLIAPKVPAPSNPPEEKKQVKSEEKPASEPILIPCDECGNLIPFPMYEFHMNEHKVKQLETAELQASTAVIPCDICGQNITFLEYEAHLKVHQPAPIPPVPEVQIPPLPLVPSEPILKKPDITCGTCGAACTLENYLLHRQAHLTEEKKIPQVIAPPQNVIALVACEICQQNVPYDQYVLHISTHQLQPPVIDPSAPDLPSNEGQLIRSSYTGKGTECTCRICLVDYTEKDTLVYLPCLHCYHEKCITDWFQRVEITLASPTCPICQKQVFK